MMKSYAYSYQFDCTVGWSGTFVDQYSISMGLKYEAAPMTSDADKQCTMT